MPSPHRRETNRLVVGVTLTVLGLVVIGAEFFLVTEPTLQTGITRPESPLVVFVHRGTRGLRITNDTMEAWDNCRVGIAGDYWTETIRTPLSARGRLEVFYKDFSADRVPRVDEEDRPRRDPGDQVSQVRRRHAVGEDGGRHRVRRPERGRDPLRRARLQELFP